MNKKYIVHLSDEERQHLNDIIKRGKTAAHRIRHAHIVLKTDADGPAWTDEAIAKALCVHVTWGLQRNEQQKGVDWHFTTNDARIRLKRLYPVIQTWLNTGEKTMNLGYLR